MVFWLFFGIRALPRNLLNPVFFCGSDARLLSLSEPARPEQNGSGKLSPHGAARRILDSSKAGASVDRWHRVAVDLEKFSSLFLFGERGSGQSYLLECLKGKLQDRCIAVATPTWNAASRIGGTSLHFFAEVNFGKLETSAEAAL